MADYKIVELPEMRLAGFTWHGTHADGDDQTGKGIGETWESSGHILAKVASGNGLWGASHMTEDGKIAYLGGAQVSPDFSPEDGIGVWDLPGGRFAKKNISLENIGDEIDAFFARGQSELGVTYRKASMLEFYPPAFDGDMRLDVFFPIH